MTEIKHVWFDMEGTLTVHTPAWEAAHDTLLLKTYAEVVGKPPTDKLWQEYNKIYQQHGTHSAAFRSLGLPSDFWQKHFMTMNEETYYQPDKRVYGTLAKLKAFVPISVFTNAKPLRLQRSLKVIHIDSTWFTYFLTGDDISERKPSLEGFHKMIEITNLPSNQILYVGDRLQADRIPAKKVGMKTALVWSVSNKADYSFENFESILTLFE
jgi:FMN phosphatase YigB (HAD superfamily)